MNTLEKPSSIVPEESSPQSPEGTARQGEVDPQRRNLTEFREKFEKEVDEKARTLNISPEEYLRKYAKEEQDIRNENLSPPRVFELPDPAGPAFNYLLHDAAQQKITTERQKTLIKQQKTAIEQSRIDTLTGLHSLKPYTEELERRSIALMKAKSRHQRQTDRKETEKKPELYSILYLDIDHFKRVNDTYGHPMGDKVIQFVADVIKANTRITDFAARIGGEEMSIILSGSDVDAAALVADRIREAVKSLTFTVGEGKEKEGEKFSVTVSIGVADYTENVEHHRALADAALQAAKGNEPSCKNAIMGTGLEISMGENEKIPEDEEDTRDQVWLIKKGVLSRHKKPTDGAQ